MWTHFVIEGYCSAQWDKSLKVTCQHKGTMDKWCPDCDAFVFCGSSPREMFAFEPLWRIIWWKFLAYKDKLLWPK